MQKHISPTDTNEHLSVLTPRFTQVSGDQAARMVGSDADIYGDEKPAQWQQNRNTTVARVTNFLRNLIK